MSTFRYVLSLLLLTGLATVMKSQSVKISGNAPSYANTKIDFYSSADLITGTEEMESSVQVGPEGNYTAEIPLSVTTKLFAYVGIYKGYFFAEPGKSYELVLPEKRDKSAEDKLNPYFEPVEIHLGLSNFSKDDLNMLIVMFDDAYYPYYDKHVNDGYSRTDRTQLDADLEQMEVPFRDYTNAFFSEYRRYKYGILRLSASQQRVQSLSDEYFNNHPVLYQNPAFAELFNNVFDKYFIFFGRSAEGEQIFEDINQKASLTSLLATLRESGNFNNDTLTELVIMKQLHDEFYGNQFSRTAILKILDSLSLNTQIQEHVKICANISQKITRLQPGFDPPSFELSDTKGRLVKLSDFRGKYVYLNFCTCQSYTCINEFNLLAEMYKRLGDKLIILTIATDPMDEVLLQFLTKNKYDWEFLLYDKQPEILKDFDIRAFPTYFLIGPDGKLIFSPAPSPAESFESKLFDLMKSRGDL
jgi:peroxiredoxin